ncbi:MAG: hypothetical protein KF901_24915 [Myxococcales bacterium]|nr:hypothetical protein [Myxococcales bacterium]
MLRHASHAVVSVLALGACGPRAGGTTPVELEPLHVEIVPLVAEDDFSQDEAQRLADEVIGSRRAREHGALPPLERRGDAPRDEWPTVTIRNATDHGLVVWFAGPCPRTSALAPHAEAIVELCEGNYDLAAELAAPDFLPFVNQGDEIEAGFAYEVTFYVVRRPEAAPRRRRAR